MASDPSSLESRLRRELEGEIHFDAFSRGRYSTDASIYQIEPVGVAVPRNAGDVIRAIQIAAEAKVPIVPRGAGTSQGGQAIGAGLVIDTSKYLTTIENLDPAARTVTVGPGVVLDVLNRHLKPHGLWFPVDVSTSAQATIGGMGGNNSAGTRSIRYGLMADNVRAIDAVLADGREVHFGQNGTARPGGVSSVPTDLAARLRTIYARDGDEFRRRRPEVLRHVAGYDLGGIGADPPDLARLLVGSEGTLAFSTRLHLALQPLPAHRVLGVCHFPTLHGALDSTRHIVGLRPSAVELVDRHVLELARGIATFRPAIDRFVRDDPAALLLVEFAGESRPDCEAALARLGDVMGAIGFADGMVPAVEPAAQAEVWAVRKAGLNIVMSMKGDGKPVSFIEDCAVPLDHLAEYADALTEIFERHGTSGTWYAHASVGCLHVRPVLNLKLDSDLRAMRAIAEQCHDLVRRYHGSHSGEHGDGLVRSEFLEPMLGTRLVRAFEEVKDAFDPGGVFNPGKIVRPPRMDDRTLMRFRPGYAIDEGSTVLDWSSTGGFGAAVEMCNNNGECRKLDAGVMCPSYRVTRDEAHTTRGRANALRLALSGQLGVDALTSDGMRAAMELCIGCKACRRECPTGVDMARMKTEVLDRHHRRHGTSVRDRLVGFLPRYAPVAAKLPWLFNLPGARPALARATERLLGFSADRRLPTWRADPFGPADVAGLDSPEAADEVALFADTFTTYFEPEIGRSAAAVLARFGYRVRIPVATGSARPLCCGRTFLNVGLVDEARAEARRTLDALVPLVRRGIPVVGLEPSCLLTLRDEFLALLPGEESTLLSRHAKLIDEFLTAESGSARPRPAIASAEGATVLVHGHCHQKAFGVADRTMALLRLIPGLSVRPIESGCCGMAGSFGYDANHIALSKQMAELDLLPAIRAAGPGTWLAASGTSCRRQIEDGIHREALHPIQILHRALDGEAAIPPGE